MIEASLADKCFDSFHNWNFYDQEFFLEHIYINNLKFIQIYKELLLIHQQI